MENIKCQLSQMRVQSLQALAVKTKTFFTIYDYSDELYDF